MTGDATPWGRHPSGREKDALKRSDELQKKQDAALASQEAEIKDRKKKLNQQAIGYLRARFSGGAKPKSDSFTVANASDASSLYNRITGN